METIFAIPGYIKDISKLIRKQKLLKIIGFFLDSRYLKLFLSLLLTKIELGTVQNLTV